MKSPAALVLAVCGLAAVVVAQQPPPAFRGSVELVTIDVQIVASQGKPIPALTAGQFDVSIAGRKRSVVFAEFLHLDEGRLTQGSRPSNTDATALAACAFGFERSSNGIHAHYVVGLEVGDPDRKGVTKVKVKVHDKDVTVRRWAWRSRIAGRGQAGASRLHIASVTQGDTVCGNRRSGSESRQDGSFHDAPR